MQQRHGFDVGAMQNRKQYVFARAPEGETMMYTVLKALHSQQIQIGGNTNVMMFIVSDFFGRRFLAFGTVTSDGLVVSLGCAADDNRRKLAVNLPTAGGILKVNIALKDVEKFLQVGCTNECVEALRCVSLELT